jgi:hypothetical protein
MKKIVVLVAAVTALSTIPASAADNVSVTATGVVAPLCEITLLSAPATTVLLNSTADQDLANYSTKCNTPASTVSVASALGFQLRPVNGSKTTPGIPYRLSVPGGPTNQTANFSYDPAATKGALKLSLANAISQIDTAAGSYSDTVTISVAPVL